MENCEESPSILFDKVGMASLYSADWKAVAVVCVNLR